MSLSEDRVQYFAHVIVDGLWKDDLVDYTDDDLAMRLGKRALVEFNKELLDIDRSVQTKIKSLKRDVVEGSSEWDVLYGKYYQEELGRRGEN